MENNNEELIIEREFTSPSDLVFKAWANPEMAMKWWGPKGFTCPVCKIDFKVGGKYLNCMRSPEDKDYWSTGVYQEIIPREKIVCNDSFADAEGNIVSSEYYGMKGFPKELHVTITFKEENGKTKMTLRHLGIPSGEIMDSTRKSWNESFDKLAESLKSY